MLKLYWMYISIGLYMHTRVNFLYEHNNLDFRSIAINSRELILQLTLQILHRTNFIIHYMYIEQCT